jgi:PASTA domain-containing protein
MGRTGRLLVLLIAASFVLAACAAEPPPGGTSGPSGPTVPPPTETTTPPIEVPDYAGMNLPAAQDDIEAKGWALRVRSAYSSEPAGTVLSQYPYPGADLEPGQTVTLRVAKARPKPPPPRPEEPDTGRNCHPSYSPCLEPASDYDCAGGSGNGPRYVDGPVQVRGYDEYDLDRDGDGIGCE